MQGNRHLEENRVIKEIEEELSTPIRVHSKRGSKWGHYIKYKDGTLGRVIDSDFKEEYVKTREELLKCLDLRLKNETEEIDY